MDFKARSIMSRNVALQLGIPQDQVSEQLIAAIEKAPGGDKLIEMMGILSKAPPPPSRPNGLAVPQSASKNHKAAVQAATHKLPIPERPISADAQKRQLQEEISCLSFCQAVKTVFAERAEVAAKKDKETAKQRQIRSFAATREHVKGDVIQAGIQILSNAEAALEETGKELLVNTEFINVHTRKMTADGNGTEESMDAQLLDSIQQVVMEKETYRRAKLSADGHCERKDKFEATLQSKIDFRVNNYYEKSLSLHEFVATSLDNCGPAKSSADIAMIQEALMAPRDSIQNCKDTIQATIDQLPKLQTTVAHLGLMSSSLDDSIKSLREKILKEHDEIVKLNKVSFNIRFNKAVDGIVSKSALSYEQALKEVQEENTARRQTASTSAVDPVTGFEVPYCVWSETELHGKIKVMITEMHLEYMGLLELVGTIKELAGEAAIFRTENVPDGLTSFQLTCDAFSMQLEGLVKSVVELEFDSEDTFGPSERVAAKNSLARAFFAKVKPLIPDAVGNPDFGGLRHAATEMIHVLAERNNVAATSVDELHILVNGTEKIKKACGQEMILSLDTDSDSSPHKFDETGMFYLKPAELLSSGPSASFYTSTPVTDAARSRRPPEDISTICFDQSST